jgi:hypothetical protein
MERPPLRGYAPPMARVTAAANDPAKLVSVIASLQADKRALLEERAQSAARLTSVEARAQALETALAAAKGSATRSASAASALQASADALHAQKGALAAELQVRFCHRGWAPFAQTRAAPVSPPLAAPTHTHAHAHTHYMHRRSMPLRAARRRR